MDDAKRRAMIKAQVTKRKETGDVDPKGTVLSTMSTKRKHPSKGDHSLKKPKVPLEPVVRLMAEAAKTVTLAKHGAGKGHMKAPSTSQEKGLFAITQVILPVDFLSIRTLGFPSNPFFCVSGHDYDERADGMVS